MPLVIASKLIGAGRGLAAALVRRASVVALDWDTRQKSRFDARDSQGRALGVFLPRGTVVRGGDVLVADDGSLIVVHAAAQPVLLVRQCSEHGSPFDLLRAAYHLGNRHVQLELTPDHLKLEPDHVLAEMLARMHLIVSEDVAAFEPEAGAYAGGAAGHGHGVAGQGPRAAQGHGLGDAHAGDHHRHDHAHHGHDHGDGHGHDHVDGHDHGDGPDHPGGHRHRRANETDKP